MGSLTLRRFNGVERFDLARAEITVHRAPDGLTLLIDAVAAETLVTNSDGAYTVSPKAELTISLTREQLAAASPTFVLPLGIDEDGGEIATFYYYEHQQIDSNTVELGKLSGARVHLVWQGVTDDPMHYDGSKPVTKVEISGWFTLSQVMTVKAQRQ